MELDEELSKLAERFNDWQNKQIDSFELNHLIHEFHNGSARDLWKRYNMQSDNSTSVARAIAEKYLQESEISEEAMNELKPTIDYFKQQIDK